jgi:hypothetical protein
VRVLGWVFVLCTVLCAITAFVPSVELRIAGRAVSKRTRLSLYTASTDRELVGRLLAAYHRSARRKTGGDVVRAVSPKLHGKARAALDDVVDAMDTLDDTSDADVRAAGIAFTIALWTLIGVSAAMALVVVIELTRGSFRRGRLILGLAMALLVTAIAISLRVACGIAVWEANDEVGRTIVSLAIGAHLMPAAALSATVAASLLVAFTSRRWTRPVVARA